jgi:hypothetical protein
MILPDFVLPTRVNQCLGADSADSFENCLDKNHFKQYPYEVIYQYNDRGFRDQAWPETMHELKKAIWCVGDSFTVGVGSPPSHTWPWLLQKNTGKRTINVSLDGASNNWIARKTLRILQEVNPQHIVIHWSYLHRRELTVIDAQNRVWNQWYRDVKDPSWPSDIALSNFECLAEYIKQEIQSRGGIPVVVSDEDRRCHHSMISTYQEDVTNIIKCIESVENAKTFSKQIIHSFIPEFGVDSSELFQYLDQLQIPYIPEFPRLDWARDHHHYDILTSQQFVMEILNRLPEYDQ